jgi:methylmalonyl-CoA mutase
VTAVKAFQDRNSQRSTAALKRLQQVATSGGNVFGELVNSVRCCSLGQISRALYDVGGQYRRSV